MKNVLTILIIVLIVLTCIPTFTFADDEFDPEAYNPDKNPLEYKDRQKIGQVTGNILGYVRTFGIILSVIILSIIGLKYIFCSLEEKANYKENMIPYVVGCFLLASATTIPSIIWDLTH